MKTIQLKFAAQQMTKEQMKNVKGGEKQAWTMDCQCDSGASFQFYYDDIDDCSEGIPMTSDVWAPYYDYCGGAYDCSNQQCGWQG